MINSKVFNRSFSLIVLPLTLLLSACGSDSVEDSPSTVNVIEPATEQTSNTPTINAKSLQTVSFNYEASSLGNNTQRASAQIDLPDQSKTAAGNLVLALDVIEEEGIDQIFIDFSNGNPLIPALQVCGGQLPACIGPALLYGSETDTQFRVFVNGINPNDFNWVSGPNVINVWVDSKLGNRTLATTFNINWQGVSVENTNADFSNVVVDASNNSIGDLTVTWLEVPDYLLYNVFISTEPNVTSDNFTTLNNGQARLSLSTNSTVFSGLDTREVYYYTVTGIDDSGESAFSLEKTITFGGVDAPVANDDTSSLNEGGTVIIDVLTNDTTPVGTLVVSNLGQPSNGTVIDNGDGTVTYSHDGSETINDAFTYVVNNGLFNSSAATVSIDITPVNDLPIATDDSANVNENSSVIINLRANDSDEETLTSSLTITNIIRPINGTVVNNNDGTVTYTHDGSNTLLDTFAYTVNDGVVDSTQATVSVTVTAVNDAPVATNDTGTVLEGASVIIDLRSNDSDEETANTALTLTNISTAANGSIVNNNDGTVTYTHDGSNTLLDTFTYTVNDGAVDSTVATVSVTVTAVNDAPVAIDDSGTVLEGGNIIIDLRSNDSDEETANIALTLTNISVATNGTIVNNNDGTVTYTHDGSNTLLDSFTYTVNDGVVDSTVATVSVTVTAVNDAPIAIDDSGTVLEGASVIIDLRTNDSDEETANALLTLTNISTAANGSIVNNNDGTITYTHDDSETITDSFTYTINDGAVDSAQATVSVTVTAVNDVPLATDDVGTVLEGASVIIDLRSNDSDEETANIALTLTNISVATNGTIVNNNDGTVTYTHDGSNTLSDSFTYTVNDGVVDSTQATVSITITPVNTPQALVAVTSFGDNGEIRLNTAVRHNSVSTLRQSDGKLVIVVNVSTNESERISVTRLNTDGTIDATYGLSGINQFDYSIDQVANHAILDATDNLYITGFDGDNGATDIMVMKVTNAGILDTSFSGDGKFEQSFINNDNLEGKAILLHSSGDLYIAAEGVNFQGSPAARDLRLVRIDTSGALVSLNGDGGLVEHDLYLEDFIVQSLAESSTGVLVVTGHENLFSPNIAAASISSSDLNFIIFSTSFDIGNVFSNFASNDTSEGLIDVGGDSFIITGASDFLNGGNFITETMMLKINITVDSIELDTLFANNGLYNEDLDGDPAEISSIYNGVVDSFGDITFIYNSFVNFEAVSFVDKMNDVGVIDVGFITQSYPSFIDQDANITLDTSNDNFYLTFDTFIADKEEVLFKQLLNDGSEVTASNQSISFSLGDELFLDMNLLSGTGNNGELLIVNDKDVDGSLTFSSVTSLNSDGSQDAQRSDLAQFILYGPTLELSDGSLFTTTVDTMSSQVIVTKYSNTNFDIDLNFVPSFGFIGISLLGDVTIEDIQYDAFSDHIVIVGTQFSSTNEAFVLKVNATDGSLYNGGVFSSGVALIPIFNDDELLKILPQTDGSYIGLGRANDTLTTDTYLMKIDGDGNFDNTFGNSGLIFSLSSGFTIPTDIVQLADSSLIMTLYDPDVSLTYMVKTDINGDPDFSFGTSGELVLDFASDGSTNTFIDDITLDANENIYGVGNVSIANDDALLIKVNPTTGVLDSSLNTATTPGYWIVDEGGDERLNQVIYDPLLDQFLLGDTAPNPTGNIDIRVRAFELLP